MPRINRRRRHFKMRGLTESQRELLIFGSVMLAADEVGFEDYQAMRRAWHEHRSELMAVHAPGRRPHAYFKFELRCEPGCWYEELRVLLDRNLIAPEEAYAAEREYPVLNGHQSPGYCSLFENPELVRAQRLGKYVLESCAAEFELAARWHAWRGRPDLARRYERRAEIVRTAAMTGE